MSIELYPRSFPSVCRALRFLAPRKRMKVISVGLGNCKALYSGRYRETPGEIMPWYE